MVCGKEGTNTMPKLFFPKKHKKICVCRKKAVILSSIYEYDAVR